MLSGRRSLRLVWVRDIFKLLEHFASILFRVFLPQMLFYVKETVLTEGTGDSEYVTGVQEVCLHLTHGNRSKTVRTGPRRYLLARFRSGKTVLINVSG